MKRIRIASICVLFFRKCMMYYKKKTLSSESVFFMVLNSLKLSTELEYASSL